MPVQRVVRAVPILALGLAAALLIMLAGETRALRKRYTELSRQASSARPGIYVPTFTSQTLEGREVRLGQADSAEYQVLFLFTTTCPYCKASLPAWKEIATAVNGYPTVEVYGISLDSLSLARAYAAEHGLEFPIVTFPERKLAPLYRVRAVPLILVLEAEGRVIYARESALESRAATDSVLAAIRIAGKAEPAADSTGAK